MRTLPLPTTKDQTMSKEAEKSLEKSLEDKIAEGVARAMEKALPLAVQAAIQTQASVTQSQHALAMAARATGEKCSVCRQLLPAGVKQGEHKHIRVAIFPKDHRHGKWFQGLFINGVRYLSNNAQHLIDVPADVDLSLIKNWEENEEVLKEGRDASHNSGDVSAPKSSTVGWR